MNISDYKNEDALDLLADLIEPTSKIFNDEDVKDAIKRKCKMYEVVKIAIKNNKDSIIEILARLDGKNVDEYECTPMSIIKDVMQILNDKELVDFFQLQEQMMVKTSSGSATENTKARKK